MKTITVQLIIISLVVFFISCNQNPQSKQQQDSVSQLTDSLLQDYKQKGRVVTKSSFQALSSALLSAIESEGVPHALQFCNIKAIPLTDSLANAYQVDVSRVSIKNRNDVNKADSLDLVFLELMQQNLILHKKTSDTIVMIADGALTYMSPIIIAPPCLQCHGIPEVDIKLENLQLISTLYPNDKATGYQLGELRGMWKIRFKN
ncbi:MAG: hypothetical protein FD155_2914 [Bacteroidetes bacterium]|nr:MAG: hypothetical protein FD155_2914 [Bacteroidota bacterium]